MKIESTEWTKEHGWRKVTEKITLKKYGISVGLSLGLGYFTVWEEDDVLIKCVMIGCIRITLIYNKMEQFYKLKK